MCRPLRHYFLYQQGPLFATVSNNIKFTTTEFLANHKIKNIIKATEHVKTLHHAQRFRVQTMLMDGEFAPMRHALADMLITFNVTSANKHVPQVERQIRIIKE